MLTEGRKCILGGRIMKKSTVMTEGSIWKKILFFSIPLILGNLFQQLYNTVDSIIVGNYIGSEALAAVGSSGSLINLLIGFCIGASAGAGVVIAQFYGAQDREGVRKAVHTTIAIAIAAGAVLTVVGIVATPILLKAMGTPQEVFDQASIYLKVYFGGILFSVVYNMSAGILNAVGNSKRSLVYLMIAATSNIFLDLLFVVVLKMGIVGAAIATDISQLLSCIFIILFLVRSEDVYRVKLKDIRCYDNLLGKILKIGLPTGVQNIVISLSNVIVQSSVNSFGAVAMAGFAAYIKVDGFNILPVLSFSMAATTFVGQNVGAGRLDRVKKGMYVSVAMGIIYTVCTGILLLAFAPQVIGVFTQNGKVVEYGVYIMKFFCPFYWMLGILHILAGTIRGTGKTMQAMVVFLFSLCIFRVLWIWGAMSVSHKIGGVMLGYPLSWLVGLVMILIYVWKGNWMPYGMKKDSTK
jgi:putative MATE family efflux protein